MLRFIHPPAVSRCASPAFRWNSQSSTQDGPAGVAPSYDPPGDLAICRSCECSRPGRTIREDHNLCLSMHQRRLMVPGQSDFPSTAASKSRNKVLRVSMQIIDIDSCVIVCSEQALATPKVFVSVRDQSKNLVRANQLVSVKKSSSAVQPAGANQSCGIKRRHFARLWVG